MVYKSIFKSLYSSLFKGIFSKNQNEVFAINFLPDLTYFDLVCTSQNSYDDYKYRGDTSLTTFSSGEPVVTWMGLRVHEEDTVYINKAFSLLSGSMESVFYKFSASNDFIGVGDLEIENTDIEVKVRNVWGYPPQWLIDREGLSSDTIYMQTISSSENVIQTFSGLNSSTINLSSQIGTDVVYLKSIKIYNKAEGWI